VAGRVRLGLAGAAGFPVAAVAAAGAVAAQYWFVAHRPLPSFQDLDPDGVFGSDTMPESRVVLLGDSTMTGPGLESRADLWSHRVARRLACDRRVRLLSVAVGGSRARDVLTEQLPQALKLDAHVAVISVGANDATHATPLGKIEADLDAVVAALGQAGVSVVLAGVGDLGNIPRLRFPLKALASRRSRAVDRIHAQVARRHAQAVKVPIAQRCDEFFRRPDAFCADLFHPNRAGHAVWADAAYPVIADALRRCVSERR
jgi:lysophospholipase L1-like esterase